MRSNVCVNHRTAHLELECRLDTRSAHRHHLDTPFGGAAFIAAFVPESRTSPLD
jgi:hypothetical protein